jgi:hypothetical protein
MENENIDPWMETYPPTDNKSYLCRMDNGYIKMCFWDGKIWTDMWETTLKGKVSRWTLLPDELINTPVNRRKYEDYMETKLSEAVKTLVEALKTDESYRIGWQASIAMAFKDEFYKTNPDFKSSSEYELHIIANKASNNFINLLCRDGNK